MVDLRFFYIICFFRTICSMRNNKKREKQRSRKAGKQRSREAKKQGKAGKQRSREKQKAEKLEKQKSREKQKSGEAEKQRSRETEIPEKMFKTEKTNSKKLALRKLSAKAHREGTSRARRRLVSFYPATWCSCNTTIMGRTWNKIKHCRKTSQDHRRCCETCQKMSHCMSPLPPLHEICRVLSSCCGCQARPGKLLLAKSHRR